MKKFLNNVKTWHDRKGKLDSSDAIKHYIKGGCGVCTLENPKSLNKYTYAFRKPRHESSFKAGVYFVYVKEKNQFIYVGMIEPDLTFRRTTASRFSQNSPEFKGAKYICDWAREPYFRSRMNLYHEGVCGCCGRKLTDPSSIRLGIGPTCRKNLGLDSFGKEKRKYSEEFNQLKLNLE